MQAFREFAGFMIGPLAPGVLVALFQLAQGEAPDAAAGFVGGAAALGYPFTIMFGAPLYLFFESRGWRAWWHYLLGGLALGAFAYFVVPPAITIGMGLSGLHGANIHFDLVALPILSGVAVVAAMVFWLIVRPDRAATA